MKAGSSQRVFGSASRTTVFRAARLTLLSAGLLGAGPAAAQFVGTQLIGHVVDASNEQSVEGVAVSATSPSMQGEQVVVTDTAGNYRVPQLPPGQYVLRFVKDSYRPYQRLDIEVRPESTIRVDVELLPETAGSETIVVSGDPPTVDVGSTTTGVQLSSAFIQAIPLTRDDRSFDQLAHVAPGAQADAFGVAISGATSPENQFVVDGLSTTNVFRGLNGSPVSVEFVDQVNIITGGFMPEYGRATGGVVTAVTKSGGNEFHGSVFGTWTPGALAATSPTILANGGTFTTSTKLYNRWDVGATLGGYIVKDRLWFFAGFDLNQVKEVRTRITNTVDPDPSAPSGDIPEFNTVGTGQSPYPGTTFVVPATDPSTGFTIVHPIPGSAIRQFSPNTSHQYIGKLTFLLNPDQRFSLSLIGQSNSAVWFPPTESAFTRANARLLSIPFLDIVGKWQASFFQKHLLLDATAGWHHEPRSLLPTDGTQPGDTTGLAGTPSVHTGNYHNLTELGQFYGPVPSQCTPVPYAPLPQTATPRTFYPCPLTSFYFGGPGYIASESEDSVQGSAVVTWLARALGGHVVKVGFSITLQFADGIEAFTGAQNYNEDPFGGAFYSVDGYGVLSAPDTPRFAATHPTRTTSSSVGGFIQDSWNILDKVTLNVGIRYDAQNIYGTDGKLGMTLPNQWSPRVGVIWDPTQRGRSKLYASFGVYYENLPAQLGYLWFPGTSEVSSYRSYRADVVGPTNVCNPIVDPKFETSCRKPANLVTLPQLSSNAGWQRNFTGVFVDPNIQPQSSNEAVIGGEYEVCANARLSATFTRRWINRVIEDMAADEGATVAFIGNPGYGAGNNFPRAVRNYTAVTLAFTKSFAEFWQTQLSYTYQSLVGNYQGLIRNGSGTEAQLSPNVTNLFDFRSLVGNGSGRLPGDIAHTVKAFGSYEWAVSPVLSMTFGGAFTASSGAPYSYLGAHALDGAGNVYILPRGSAGTLPWVWNLDLKLGLSSRLSQATTLNVAVDCFNVLNSAQVTAIDENYTFMSVLPISGGTVQGLKGTPSTLHYSNRTVYDHVDDNPNYGRPQAYQPPRAFRFSARVSF